MDRELLTMDNVASRRQEHETEEFPHNEALKAWEEKKKCLDSISGSELADALVAVFDINPRLFKVKNAPKEVALYLESLKYGVVTLKLRRVEIGFENCCRLLERREGQNKESFRERLRLIRQLYPEYINDLFELFRQEYQKANIENQGQLFRTFDRLRLRYPYAYYFMANTDRDFTKWISDIDKVYLSGSRDSYNDGTSRPGAGEKQTDVDKNLWNKVYSGQYDRLYDEGYEKTLRSNSKEYIGKKGLKYDDDFSKTYVYLFDVLSEFDGELSHWSFQNCYNYCSLREYNKRIESVSFDESQFGEYDENYTRYEDDNDPDREIDKPWEVHFISKVKNDKEKELENREKLVGLFHKRLSEMPQVIEEYREFPVFRKMMLSQEYGDQIAESILDLLPKADISKIEYYVQVLKSIVKYSHSVYDVVLGEVPNALKEEYYSYPEGLRILAEGMDRNFVEKKLEQLAKREWLQMQLDSGILWKDTTPLSDKEVEKWIKSDEKLVKGFVRKRRRT